MVYKIIQKIVILNFTCILVISLIAIVFRYVLNSSLYWSDEIVRYLFIWLTFSASALLVKEDRHIKVELFLEKAGPRMKTILERINFGVALLVTLFFVAGGLVWMWQARGMESPALGLPIHWIVYGALPISFLAALWFLLKPARK